MSSKQISFICLDQLVSEKHQYRKFKELFDFEVASKELKAVESGANYKGYGILRLFKCLLLQFMEDLSDRELERYLSGSNAAKWFCDFNLTEVPPDHSVFSKLRSKIGILFCFEELATQNFGISVPHVLNVRSGTRSLFYVPILPII